MNRFLPAASLCIQLCGSCSVPVLQQYPPVPAHRNVTEEDNALRVSVLLVSNSREIWRLAGGQKQQPGHPGSMGNEGEQ